MGTYGSYKGSCLIEDNKKDSFNEQMTKVLNYGGMMSFEQISMYGHKMGLLKPFEVYPGGSMDFHYNYFEDDFWETAEYDAENTRLYSQKIGGSEFNDVITAAYFLFEMYDSEAGLTYIDGDVVNKQGYVGWLNHLLGMEFSMSKRLGLWENAEVIASQRMEWRREKEDDPNSDVFAHDKLMQIIPEKLRCAAGGTELADLLYTINGTDILEDEKLVPESYPYDVWQCKRAIVDFIKEYKEDAYDKFIEILKMDREGRNSLEEGVLKQIGQLSQFMPARVFLYLFCEQKKILFWKRWFEVKADVYKDEQMKKYASEELEKFRRQKINEPIEKVRTSDFLRQGYWGWIAPEEVRDMKKVYTTDDDRMYWWDGTDEVIISEETKQWLTELDKRHKELKKELEQNGKGKNYKFLENFLQVLKEVDEYYRRIFPFQSMFYEFLQNGSKPEYIAAVELLREIANNEDNQKAGKLIELVSSSWDLTDGRITRNKGRLNMKRYMAVMANPRLREVYFGF